MCSFTNSCSFGSVSLRNDDLLDDYLIFDKMGKGINRVISKKRYQNRDTD